ncbi:TolC family outer membrane protein [Desulforhopalus sp. 52FAK]
MNRTTVKWCVFFITGFLLSSNNVFSETLSEAVQEVILTNPQIRSQAYNRFARDEEVRQAGAANLPTLDFMTGVGVQDFQEPDDGDYNPVEYGLSLRWNIFKGFATMNEVDRQEARVRSAAYGVRGVSENLALRASRVYLNVLRAEELKELAEQNLLIHQRLVDQINLRSQSGVGAQVDAEQAQGRLALAESNVVVTNTNLLDSKSNYLSVVGHLPGSLQRPADVDDQMPGNLDEAVRRAEEEHPTLQSAIADLEAREEQHEVAASPYYPTIDIEVDQTWEEEVDGTEEREESTRAMLRLRYNLFNGFEDQARKAETLQLISEAREIKNNTQRQVVESTRLSWMAYQSVLDRKVYLEQHAESTKATARTYTQQFNIGKRSLLDVLDTEAEAITAQKDVINAIYDGLYSQFRILNSMGGLVHGLGLDWADGHQVEADEEKQGSEDEGN